MALTIEAWGVTLDVVPPAGATETLLDDALPPGWLAGDPGRSSARIEAQSLPELAAAIRMHVATHAPAHTFIHAGAVAVGSDALLLPGPTLSGKSTLVAECIHLGAIYLSDEFAVLDDAGRVHPYPKLLSLRRPGDHRGEQTEVSLHSLGGGVATGSFKVTLVAALAYMPGVSWLPSWGSSAAAALALYANAVAAQLNPETTINRCRRACEGARLLQSPRGEAPAAARSLLAMLGEASARRET